jgi:hypothetical protein
VFEHLHHLKPPQRRNDENYESACDGEAICHNIAHLANIRTSSSSGAATLTNKHRLRIGEMILLVEFAHMMILIFVEYFSMVLRNAAWASRLSWSASLMMTTVVVKQQGHGGEWDPGSPCFIADVRRTFEFLFSIQIDLLGLSNLFEDILDDYPVVYPHIAKRHMIPVWDQQQRLDPKELAENTRNGK